MISDAEIERLVAQHIYNLKISQKRGFYVVDLGNGHVGVIPPYVRSLRIHTEMIEHVKIITGWKWSLRPCGDVLLPLQWQATFEDDNGLKVFATDMHERRATCLAALKIFGVSPEGDRAA